MNSGLISTISLSSIYQSLLGEWSLSSLTATQKERDLHKLANDPEFSAKM